MIKTIKNYNKENPQYLSLDTVLACFVVGSITHIDKLLCGNGFTTKFLELIPRLGYHNVILFPNRSAIKSKEKHYAENSHLYDNELKFFYGGSKDKDFSNANVLCFVIDSFVTKYAPMVNANVKVDKLLIDEFHSTEEQSSFRNNLKNLLDKINAIVSNDDVAISTVTASPMFTSKVDIQIEMENNDRVIKVAHSKDQSLCVERIVQDYKNGKTVVIGTQSSLLIKKINNELGKPLARYEIGKAIKNRLVRETTVNVCNGKGNARVVFVSGAGFEGFDLKGYNNASMYFIEDRGTSGVHKTQNFNPQKMYQFFNRIRIDKNNKGADYFEYNRQETDAVRRLKVTENQLDKFLADTSISNEKKQKSDYKKFHPFIIFTDKEHRKEVAKDKLAFRLHEESLAWDLNFNDFVHGVLRDEKVGGFFSNRNIRFYNIDEGSTCKRLSLKSANPIDQEKYLLSNIDVIESDFNSDEPICMFGDKHIIKTSAEAPQYIAKFKKKDLLKEIEIYLREKNYNGEYTNTFRQDKAIELLSCDDKFNALCKDVLKDYKFDSIEKYGTAGSKDWIASFKEESEYFVASWIMALANDEVRVFSKWRGHRDYNLSTQRSFGVIEIISNEFNLSVTDLDIESCFPRVLHALCGLDLPSNFYGEGKKNKVEINKWLNKVTYTGETVTASDRKKLRNHKSHVIAVFKEFNFADKVIDFLIDGYLMADYKSDLFTRLSYEEKKIMSKVDSMLNQMPNEGVVGRHDGKVIFGNMSDHLSLFNTELFKVGDFISDGWFKFPLPITEEQHEYVEALVKDNQGAEQLIEDINHIGYGL